MAWPQQLPPDQQGNEDNGNSYCIVVGGWEQAQASSLDTAGHHIPSQTFLGTQREAKAASTLKVGRPKPLPLGAEGR